MRLPHSDPIPAIVDSLEARRLFAGLTLLAHGFTGNIDGWVKKVAADITTRAGGASSISSYVLTVESGDSNRLAVTSFELESGFTTPQSTTTADVIVKLDWSAVSGGAFSTGQVAEVVTDFLLASRSGQIRLAELPMHLIGHSRGASLITAMSAIFGQNGIWVDQQTNLDPHPVDGHDDILNFDFNDYRMATYDNVTFADTYWRTDGDTQNVDFDGEPVAGTHQGDLNNSVQADFDGSKHNAVPSYYDGTINLTATDGGDTPIDKSWYGTTPDKPARDQTGYLFSRFVAGARPADGLWAASSGTASRVATIQKGTQWANVGDVQIQGGRTFVAGKTIKMRYIRQDRDGKSNVAFLLDRDQNPFNNNFVRTLRSTNLNEADIITANRSDGSTNGATPGTYWACARMTDSGGHVRYAYSKSIKLTAPASAAAESRESQRIITRRNEAELFDALG